MKTTIQLKFYQSIFFNVFKESKIADIIYDEISKSKLDILACFQHQDFDQYVFQIEETEHLLQFLCKIISYYGYFIRIEESELISFIEVLSLRYKYASEILLSYQQKILHYLDKANLNDTQKCAKKFLDAELALLIANDYQPDERDEKLQWIANARLFKENHPLFIKPQNLIKLLAHMNGVPSSPWLFEDSSRWLLDALASCPTIIHLFINEENGKEYLTKNFTDFILNSHIHTLCITSSRLTLRKLKISDLDLDVLLPCIPQLKKLDLSNQAITDTGFMKLVDVLSHASNCKLEELNLYNCSIRNKGINYLLEHISHIPSLRHFLVRTNYCDANQDIVIKLDAIFHYRYLRDYLQHRLDSVSKIEDYRAAKVIAIHFSVFDDELIHIVNILSEISTTKTYELEIKNCKITAKSARYLLEHLDELPSLYKINLGENNCKRTITKINILLLIRTLTSKLSPVIPHFLLKKSDKFIHKKIKHYVDFNPINSEEIQKIIMHLTSFLHQKIDAIDGVKNAIKINIFDYMARQDNTRHDYRNILNLFLLFNAPLDDGLFNLFTYCLGSYFLLHTYDKNEKKKIPYIFDRIHPSLEDVIKTINSSLIERADEKLFKTLIGKFHPDEYNKCFPLSISKITITEKTTEDSRSYFFVKKMNKSSPQINNETIYPLSLN